MGAAGLLSDHAPVLMLATAVLLSSMTVALADTVGCQGFSSAPDGGLQSAVNNTIIQSKDFDPSSWQGLAEDDYRHMIDLYRASVFSVLVGKPDSFYDFPGASHGVHVSVALGEAGRALMFLKLYIGTYRYSILKAKQYMSHAYNYINIALDLLPHDVPDIGFLRGSSGIYAVAAIIYQIAGEATRSYNMVLELKSLISKAAADPNAPMSLENGIAGLAYSARFLNSYYQDEIITGEEYDSLINALIENGIKNIDQDTKGWHWKPSGVSDDMGLYGGDAGPAYTIMQRLLFDEEGVYKNNQTIMTGLNLTITVMKQKYDKHEEARVDLYAGAPSYIPVFLKAYQLFGIDDYYKASLDAATFTARNGILNTGMQLARGTTGNAYMIMWLASELNEMQALGHIVPNELGYENDIDTLIAYANSMHKVALGTTTLTDTKKMVSYNCANFSFWQNSPPAMAMAYLDIALHQKSPLDVKMPAFSEIL